MHNRAPTYRQLKSGEIEVVHNEYIGDLISGSSGGSALSPFTSQVYPINPGLSYFSFLSGLAANYELYDFRRFRVVLKSISGNALTSTNTALGSMGVSTLYNATSILPQQKYSAESYQGATSGVPSKSQVHNVMVSNVRNPLGTLYVRTGNLSSSQNQNMYDLGQIVVWSQGCQTTVPSALCEIWFQYSVVLKDPRTYAGQLAFSNLTSAYQSAAGTGITKNNLWGSAMVANSNNQQTVSLSNDGTSSYITFPSTTNAGSYLISYNVNSNAVNPGNNLVTFAGTSCSALNIFENGTNFLGNAVWTSTGTTASYVFSCGVQIANTSPLVPPKVGLNASAWTSIGTPTSANLLILPINGNVTTVT
jgi:hypothetical protein